MFSEDSSLKIEPPRRDWIDYKLIAAVFITAIFLGAANWALGRSGKSGTGEAAKNATPQTAAQKPKERVKPMSGRQLTIAKMQQPKIPAQHFEDDVYGVSFDAPKGYSLKEGEL